MTAAQIPAVADVPGRVRRPGRPRSERADRAIMDATVSLFAESGADGLSLREVARRAGVSHAAPRRHFPDKRALLGALAERGYTVGAWQALHQRSEQQHLPSCRATWIRSPRELTNNSSTLVTPLPSRDRASTLLAPSSRF